MKQFLLALVLTVSSLSQTPRTIFVFFDNPQLELRDQSRGDSSALPFGEYPVERRVLSKTPEKQAILELLEGPSKSETDSGYSTNLANLRLSLFSLRNGLATVQLKAKFVLKGTLSGPRLRSQVERTLKQFKTVRRVIILINGKKDFDSFK